MNLTEIFKNSGTSEGVKKEWETRKEGCSTIAGGWTANALKATESAEKENVPARHNAAVVAHNLAAHQHETSATNPRYAGHEDFHKRMAGEHRKASTFHRKAMIRMMPNRKFSNALFNSETKESDGSKIPKEAVLYIFRPETQYTCNKCVNYHATNMEAPAAKCALLAAKETIKPFGSCGFWIHMDPFAENSPFIPSLAVLLKTQAGYAENKNGFSCKRCEYFDPEKLDCRKVDKDSEGDTPGMIHPNACCNRWEADDIRSKKTTEELNAIFESKA